MQDLIEKFFSALHIDPYVGILINKMTGETRAYQVLSSLNRIPASWKNSNCSVQKVIFSEPKYPDLFEPSNFLRLIEIHWEVVGYIGSNYYVRYDNETFQERYIKTRIKGFNNAYSLGGGEILDTYRKKLLHTRWKF